MRVGALLLVFVLGPFPVFAGAPVYLGSFGSGGSGTNAAINPMGLALAADGTVWVALAGLDKAKHFTTAGTYLGETVTPITWPTGVAVLSTGEIVVSSSGSVARYQPDGTGKTDLGIGGAFAVLADAAGGFVAAQQSTRRLLSWPGGTSIPFYWTPAGFDRSGDGTYYVANSTSNRIDVFGGPQPGFSFGSTGSAPGQFSGPADVKLHQGLVLVADSGNNRVQIFRRNGEFVGTFGTAGTGPGQMLRPSGLAVTDDGTVLVSELSNNRVSRFGDLATAASPGSWGRIKTLYR